MVFKYARNVHRRKNGALFASPRVCFNGNKNVLFLSRFAELRNGTACKEEILQLACGDDEVLAIHSAVFDGHDTKGCGILMPINISTLITPAIAADHQKVADAFAAQGLIPRLSINQSAFRPMGGSDGHRQNRLRRFLNRPRRNLKSLWRSYWRIVLPRQHGRSL